MKKLLICLFVIALFFCLLNSATAIKQNDMNENINITEDSFAILSNKIENVSKKLNISTISLLLF